MTPRSSSDLEAPDHMKRKTCARKCERACCSAVTYFPLVFVYGITTWAAWVLANMALRADTRSLSTSTLCAFGIFLYILLNWCYTTAVFTSPGSPSASSAAGYSSLPTHETASILSATSFTVKSTGGTRFCKKCQALKPDRAHHCSTCKQCVLKMDHHCPWLATCVGLRNYKSFLLFLTYTSVFCWICFAATTKWLWKEVFSEAQYTESLMPVNYIMLSVISAIIGLVLTGFTGWHISMAIRGLTTIECLEKTRYLSPLRKTMRNDQLQRDRDGEDQGYGQQLAEIHANALPGVTRPEEGETILRSDEVELGAGRDGDTDVDHHRSYASLERAREHQRYEEYLDEQDSGKLPNAFDLGWKRNLLHLFGNKPLLWGVPFATTMDDGWRWEPNPKWIEAREALRQDREQDAKARGQAERSAYPDHYRYRDHNGERRHYVDDMDGATIDPSRDTYYQGGINDRPGSQISMKTLKKNVSFDGDDHYEVSSDEDDELDAEVQQDGQSNERDGIGRRWP